MRSLECFCCLALSGCFLAGYESHDLPDEAGMGEDGGMDAGDGAVDGSKPNMDAQALVDSGPFIDFCTAMPGQCGPIAPCADSTCTCADVATVGMDGGLTSSDAGVNASVDCTFECAAGSSCRPTCRPGEHCQTSCRLAESCRTECSSGAECDVYCGTGICRGDCESGSTCSFECIGGSCTEVRCSLGARCTLHCTDTNKCSFARCMARQEVCDGGKTVVCGTACP